MIPLRDLSADERRTYLATTLQQCRRLVRLVEQLLEVAKLDARQVTTAPEPFQLAELVQDVAMKVDNLMDNALRYAGRGGCVTVRVISQPSTVRLEVHDTGPGIPEGERGRVFERFYRGDKSRSSESGHAGLGLSIARSILELHGRPIDFVSAPERGTTFFFELPTVRTYGDEFERFSRNLGPRNGANMHP